MNLLECHTAGSLPRSSDTLNSLVNFRLTKIGLGDETRDDPPPPGDADGFSELDICQDLMQVSPDFRRWNDPHSDMKLDALRKRQII